MPETIAIRRVTDPRDPAIRSFGALQERVYADPDLLIPPEVLPHLLLPRKGRRQNFMLLAEAGDQVVGGTIFHYLGDAHSGFSSFLAVAPEARGHGLARRLHTERFALLDQAAGAAGPVPGIFIDVVAPERLSPEALAAERAVGLDPADRRRIFHRMGFRKVDVAYYQPEEGSGGEPVTTMDLLFCPRAEAEWVSSDLVANTMRAYWTDWLGRVTAEKHAAELRRRCGGERVRLLPA